MWLGAPVPVVIVGPDAPNSRPAVEFAEERGHDPDRQLLRLVVAALLHGGDLAVAVEAQRVGEHADSHQIVPS